MVFSRRREALLGKREEEEALDWILPSLRSEVSANENVYVFPATPPLPGVTFGGGKSSEVFAPGRCRLRR